MRRTLLPILCLVLVCAQAGADELQNIADDGWSTSVGYRFSGRLTEVREPAAEGSGALKTLYRRTRLLFTSGEEGRVGWSVDSLHWQTRADDHGYWELAANQPLDLPAGWYTVATERGPDGQADFLVHDERNRFGLISDIDDTILVSEVASTRQLLKNSLTLPPEARKPVPGMAALYRRLLQRNAQPEASPVFYVSATPRQLTQSVRRFLRHNDFPRGVLQLKEIDPESGDPLLDQEGYKVQRIGAILQAFPNVHFTLIGDDGERDPESFATLQASFPEQIDSVWIRRVSTDPDRPRPPGQGDLAQLLGDGG